MNADGERIYQQHHMFQHSIGKKIAGAKKTVYCVGSVWD